MFSAVRTASAARAFTRSFSTTQTRLADVAKLTLVGRLGSEPTEKRTSTDKPYFVYAIATRSPGSKDESGKYIDGPTSWHNVFSFNENQHEGLRRLGKGSTVYVEADMEMRKSDPIDGQNVPDRVFLRQLSLKTITRAKTESEGEGESSE